MQNVTFRFNGKASRRAKLAAAAVAIVLEERGHSSGGPYFCSDADAEDAAELIGGHCNQVAVLELLKNCEFNCPVFADRNETYRLVRRLEDEIAALRSDLGLVHRYAIALEKRIVELEGARHAEA